MNVIFLTGFMATGKTAVGRLLAARLDRPFVDTDAEVERAAGTTVAAIFRDRGETEFRRLESDALMRAAELPNAVVATGGGAPTIEANRMHMHRSGTIVRLAAAPEAVLARVGEAEDRPLLAGARDRAARVRELLTSRESAYADADATVDTTGLTPSEVVDRIVDVLRSTQEAEVVR